MNTFKLDYADAAELERKLMAILSSAQKWQTVGEVANRYRTTANTMTMRLKRFQDRGGEFEAEYGESGRILRMKVSPVLHAYMERLC